MLLTLLSLKRFKTVSMLGYLSYQQSDFVLVVTRYYFSTIASLYAFLLLFILYVIEFRS